MASAREGGEVARIAVARAVAVRVVAMLIGGFEGGMVR